MPFDNLPTVTTPSLATLAEILRDRSRWPTGFVWDYTSVRGCAMGLMCALWHVGPIFFRNSGLISLDESITIFNACHIGIGKLYADVTPEDVADAIDAYLARAA